MHQPLSEVVDEVLGADYAPGGRGPAYDCLGLALLVAERCFGRRLPDPRVASPHALRAQLRRVDDGPQPGDWLYHRKGGGHDGAHFAIAEADGWAVEAHRQFGVHRLRLSEALDGASVWRLAT